MSTKPNKSKITTKSRILEQLEKHRGVAISGEKLAEELDVSRTAVWKAISELRNKGYSIEAVTNKGYILTQDNSLLSTEAITPHIEKHSSQNNDELRIHIYETIDSTNEEAKRLLLKKAKPNTIILAENQEAGKGRRGRGFFSPDSESIYSSYILSPPVDAEKSLLITVAASVAVCRAIENFNLFLEKNNMETDTRTPEIKWVNDIYMDGKKVCGILTEATTDLESGQLESVILGIGVNINIPKDTFPKEIQDTATSYQIPTGTRNIFAAYLINEVFAIQNEFSTLSFMDEYKKRSMIIGKDIFVIKNDQKIKAQALSINNDGSLQIKYAEGESAGEIENLNSGEVSIRAI